MILLEIVIFWIYSYKVWFYDVWKKKSGIRKGLNDVCFFVCFLDGYRSLFIMMGKNMVNCYIVRNLWFRFVKMKYGWGLYYAI